MNYLFMTVPVFGLISKNRQIVIIFIIVLLSFKFNNRKYLFFIDFIVYNEHKKLNYLAADSILFLVPPLNIAFTSSQAWTTSSGGVPLNFICLLQELKLAASGCTYLSPGPTRWE